MERFGLGLLATGFSLGVLLILYTAWAIPDAIPFIPLALLGLAGVVFLLHHPLLNLALVLGAFVVVSGYESGIQVSEALYGLYALGLLAYWFATRLLFYRDPVLRPVESRALFFFLVGVTLTMPLTIVFDGWLSGMFSEWVALLMLGFYFPVREAFTRYDATPKVILALLLWIGIYATLRNLLEYQTDLSAAEHAWQVARGRVITNDNILMVVSLASLSMVIFAQRWRDRLLLLVCFLLVFAGLILTLSRGYWLAFALGASFMFVLIETQHKKRLLLLTVGGIVGVLSIMFVFFQDYMVLILGGLVERFTSIKSATSQDVSLLNRFVETKGAWEHIATNPILGHGMGVPYRYYDIADSITMVKTFIHNGYISLWYRFGIWGLGLFLTFWGLSIFRGVQAFRNPRLPLIGRLCGLIAAIALTGFLLSANTSNPFFLNDSTFVIGFLTGIAGGAYARAQQHGRIDHDPPAAQG